MLKTHCSYYIRLCMLYFSVLKNIILYYNINMETKVKTPSQLRAINSKNNILNASFKLFTKNGYKGTNTNLIAKSAKVSVGVIYSYYKDKEELFELWLNSLLERCDDYFYNQLKLTQYGVELPMIISNILDKTSELFFSSPVIYEKDPFVLKTLDSFYDKVKNIFAKSCYEAMINLHHQHETTHLILELFISYNKSLSNDIFRKNYLKNCYIKSICTLLDI